MNSTEGRAWYVTLDTSLSHHLRATQIHLRDWRDITCLLPSPSIFCIGWMKPVLDSYPVSRSCLKRPRQSMMHCFRYLFALAQTLRIFGARRFRLCYGFLFVLLYAVEPELFLRFKKPLLRTIPEEAFVETGLTVHERCGREYAEAWSERPDLA